VLRAHPRPYGISACSLRMVFLSRTSVRTPLGHSLMSGTCPRMPIWLAPNAGPLKFMPQPRGAVASVYRAASRYHLRALGIAVILEDGHGRALQFGDHSDGLIKIGPLGARIS
jgi:hypothetical protein